MSSDERSNAFNEVRAILGKLDRSIDEARSRRLEPEQPVRREQTPPASENRQSPAPDNAELDREIGAGPAKPRGMTELQKKAAAFGRAKPLNRAEEKESPPRQWKSTSGDDEFIG